MHTEYRVSTLAWRNLWRQPRRTVLTLMAIAFATLIMVLLMALQVGTYATMEANTMSLLDGYAQVQPRGYLDDPGIRKSFDDVPALTRRIAQLPGIDVVTPRTQTYALLSKGQRSLAAMVVGVAPETEARVSRIAATVKQGRYLQADDAAEVVLGAALARNLKVGVGDKVTLLGMGRDGSVAADVLTVTGIFDSGMADLDRQLAEMPLKRFQADFAMVGQVNLLAISGKSLGAVDRALPAVKRLVASRKLVVRDWGALQPGLKNAIQLDASTSLLWYAVLVFVSVAILLNTILMSVLERTREFGILLALGMRPGAAARMVWLEILILLALGLMLGIGIGASIAGWFSVHGLVLPGTEGVFAQWGLPGAMYPKLTPLSLFAGPGAIALFTALAGLYPFWRLHRLDPLTAMRAT